MGEASQIHPSGDANISSWLRSVLAGRGLTQRQAAEMAGVSVQVIHHLANGAGRRPHPDIIERLERAFGEIPASHRDDVRDGPYTRMTVDQLLDHCRGLYRNGGPEALLYRNIKRTKGLYSALYAAGLRQRVLLAKLGLDSATFREKTTASRDRTTASGKRRTGWNRDRVLAIAKDVVEERGHLPTAGWFRANGHRSLVQALYGLGMTWGDLHDALGIRASEAGGVVKSRNGMWWRSHSEACLSNYLHARGVEHRLGDDYPEAYAAMSGRKSGQYDVAFRGDDGEWFNVEVWGDKPHGHDADGYRQKRTTKEAFNARNGHFVGIHFTDCWSDAKLDALIGPLIGTGRPIANETPHDHLIQTVHWSDADELIAFCRTLAAQQPDGQFPAEDWLRKRGKHASRSGPAYNTLSVYIKTLIGGIRKLREIIGQSHVSTVKWTRESAAAELVAWVGKYGMPPSVTAELARRRGHELDRETILRGQNINAAIERHFGRITIAYRELGLTVSRTTRIGRVALKSRPLKIPTL